MNFPTLLETLIWNGAEADYDKWRATGPTELPPFGQADPHIAQVFMRRAELILTTAMPDLYRIGWGDTLTFPKMVISET